MKGSNLIFVVVALVAAVIFLPRIMQQMKGFNLNTLFSGGGAQASTSPGGQTQTSTIKQTGSGNASVKAKNGNYDIDVSGNGCACANGVCEGNCSDMEEIDLENFDPLEWVESQV